MESSRGLSKILNRQRDEDSYCWRVEPDALLDGMSIFCWFEKERLLGSVSKVDIWNYINIERHNLVEDLKVLGVDNIDWGTESLCQGWSVLDVAKHIVDIASTSTSMFILKMAASGFSLDRMNSSGIVNVHSTDGRSILEKLENVTDLKKSPPIPKSALVAEIILHGEDIRRPLGIVHQYESSFVTYVFEYYLKTSTRFGGGKERSRGLKFEPEDADGCYGEGLTVHGSLLDILLAVSGRRAALDRLGGEGIDVLTARLSA